MARKSSKRWKRWTESEARSILDEASRSGRTLRDYGVARGFGARRLDRWARRLGLAAAGEPQVSFEEIVPVRGSTAVEPFEVVLSSGRVVRVPPSFETAVLQRLLGLLENDAC